MLWIKILVVEKKKRSIVLFLCLSPVNFSLLFNCLLYQCLYPFPLKYKQDYTFYLKHIFSLSMKFLEAYCYIYATSYVDMTQEKIYCDCLFICGLVQHVKAHQNILFTFVSVKSTCDPWKWKNNMEIDVHVIWQKMMLERFPRNNQLFDAVFQNA